ncbi:manganese efflux pump MntP family protein [Myxococcus sp. K15C18031901]|uniref:manganese efflux pump MntP n=1 Tax=Myxococcus dinghuensis TaxID=2906761 RepID=UPI0020A705B6|nr:manganese efflux pump MntP family protein [Myxococcus dinghuensis]MCP3100564.1 manganese efflux pump MntP family protein [Myxococcus dinghuensis]
MTLLLIALGVAMDATAVSGSMAIRGARPADVFKLALTFGLFQFGMSLAGALGGKAILARFASIDHWIAFGLLAAVGGHMLWEAFSHDEAAPRPATGIPLPKLLTLGVATSIDALAVGATLPALELDILVSTGVIGVTTAVLSVAGAWAGRRLGERFGTSLEVLGGLVLIGIGLKTLLEHLGQ